MAGQCSVGESESGRLRNDRDDPTRCENNHRSERYLGNDDDASLQWGVIWRDRDAEIGVPCPLPKRVAAQDEGSFTHAEFDDCSRVVVTGGKLTLERRPDLEVRQVLPDRVSSQLVGAAMVRRSDSEGHGPVWQTT